MLDDRLGIWGCLKYAHFRRMWLGQTVSAVGDSIFPIAMAIRVLDSGGGATGVGVVFAAKILATVVFILIGGVVADRFKRTRVMVGADVVRLLAVLAIAAVPTGIPLPILAALTFAVGAGEAFFRPAYGAVLPSLLPPQALQAGNAATSVSLRAASVIGPGSAGVLIGILGVRAAFLFDAGTFAVSLVSLLSVAEPARLLEARQRFHVEIGDGIRAVVERPWIAAILVMANLQLMLSVAPNNVLLPVVARARLGGNAAYGALAALFSVGALVGAVVGSRIRPRHPGVVGMIGILPYGLVSIALAAGFPFLGVAAVYLVAGFGLEPFQVLWATALQREVPTHLLARVSSLDWFGSLALLPLGYVLTGPAVSRFGQGPVLVFAGLFIVFSSLAVLVVPGVPGLANPRSRSDPAGQAPG